MNDMSLSRLYRRLVSGRPQPAIDAADLVDAANLNAPRREALATKLAASTEHADLARMLNALEPDSRALAEAVAGERRVTSHPARTRDVRPAAGARRGRVRHLRWAGAAAACLAVALGLWSGRADLRGPAQVASVSRPAHGGDRIFTTKDEIFAATSDSPRPPAAPAARGGDELFHADFSS